MHTPPLPSLAPLSTPLLLALLALLSGCGSSDSSTQGNPPSPGGTPEVSSPENGASSGGDPANPNGGPGAPNKAGVAPKIPKPTGTCPAIAGSGGDVTFAPAGVPPRKVKIALDANAPPATTASAPLLFYWHATGSAPSEAAYSLGETAATFKSGAGGVIVAPYADPTAGQFEWFIVNQSPKLDDFLLADEVVACLVEAKRIDPTRVHSMGMSAGGLQTTAFSFLRSSYVASVVTFSGGLPDGFEPAVEDPTNKFAALIFEGGATDNVFGLDFQAASERYRSTLTAAGHFTAICDHGGGHTIPRDAASSVVAFFAANPFGAWPSPYASSGLPTTFPAYCKR